MQDQNMQPPRRDFLIPSSLLDTSDDEEAIFTPGPEYSSAATTALSNMTKRPPQPMFSSRPTTPKASNGGAGGFGSVAVTNGGTMSIPITPSGTAAAEKEKKRKREQTPMDDAQLQVLTENSALLNRGGGYLVDRRTKSPSPATGGTIRPIIKKSPKRANVRFADLRGGSLSSGVQRKRNSVDASVQFNNGQDPQQEEEESDTLEEDKATGSPKTRRRRGSNSGSSRPNTLISSTPLWTTIGLLGGVASMLLWTTLTTPPHQSKLQTVCEVPGIHGLSNLLPFCQPASTSSRPNKAYQYHKGDQPPPDYGRLIELQFSFEKILEDSVGGTRLAYDMKTSEMAVRDLTTLVKVSGLACREQLSVHLDTFGDTARIASRSLSRFSSRVMGTIDSILALDEWAKKTLEEIRDSERGSMRGISSLVLWRDHAAARREVEGVFLKTTESMDGQLQRLVREAQAVLEILDELEERLSTIHEIVSRETNHVTLENAEVLSAILTKLGANRQKIARNKEHVKLLNNVSLYRKTALNHVSATVVELERMSADLEQLREAVAAPSLLEGVVEVPIELHIRNIDQGIVRLTAGRVKASSRKDEYHQALLAGIDFQNKMIHAEISGGGNGGAAPAAASGVDDVD